MKGYMLWLLILFFVTCSFYFLLDSPSYVLISFKSYTFETTLLSFILCLASLFVVLYIIKTVLLFFLNTIPSFCKNLKNNDKNIKNKFYSGVAYTFLGECKTAYKYFSFIAKSKQKNFIYTISAAILASRNKNYIEAKNWLTESKKDCSTAEQYDAINIVLSKIYVNQKQYEQAYDILIELNSKYPLNFVILPMLMTTLTYFKDWGNLLSLLPDIKKINILGVAEYIDFEYKVIYGFLHKVVDQTNSDKNLNKDIILGKLNYNWSQLPTSHKKKPDYISIYVKSLIMANCNELAKKILEQHLCNGIYNLELISIYGNLKSNNYAKQLKILETLANEFHDNYKFMFLLGKSSLNNKLLGKAHSYFEKSIAIQKNSLAYKGMADIYLFENNPEQAIKFFNLAFNELH
jgi:HemY protein